MARSWRQQLIDEVYSMKLHTLLGNIMLTVSGKEDIGKD